MPLKQMLYSSFLQAKCLVKPAVLWYDAWFVAGEEGEKTELYPVTQKILGNHRYCQVLTFVSRSVAEVQVLEQSM